MYDTKIENLEVVLTRLLKKETLPEESYLAGGTALYFLLHHRLSIDLDFFTLKPFHSEQLLVKMREIFDPVDTEIIEKKSLILFLSEEKIKFSLFHLPHPLLSALSSVTIGESVECPLASLEDIEAMKALALAQRGAAKDFVDLFHVLRNTGHTFEDVASNVRKKYNLEKKYDYHLRTAMTFFDDAEEDLDMIMLLEPGGGTRKMTKKEWDEIKDFFLRFCR